MGISISLSTLFSELSLSIMLFQYNFVIYHLPYVCIKLYVDNMISTHSVAVQLRLIVK